MMVIPDEFLQLAQAFHQDSRIGVVNEQEWIAARLASLDSAQRRVVKTFLTELLIQCRDDAKLRQLWNSTDADFYIDGDQGGRYFLTLIRDSIQ
ncbi:MAG: hypothetical protein QOJ86_426 [Bradyrhizobium sp.]|jgi:hypothetical protein|nr:hypothetical protein [Bradyrhizobium sp.]